MPTYEDFQEVYHLVGGQALPVFLNAIQFPQETTHVLIATEETINTAKNVKASLTLHGKTQVPSIISLGPKEVANDFRKLRGQLEKLFEEKTDTRKICFDITGGTKPMAIVSLEIAKKHGIQAMYLDSNVRQCWWLLPQEISTDVEKRSMKLEEFLGLAGTEIKSSPVNTLPSREFLDYLFDSQEWISVHIKKLENMINARKQQNPKYDIKSSDFETFLEEIKEDSHNDRPKWDAYWKEFTQIPNYGKWRTQQKFLMGGWFESYTYYRLLDMKEAQQVKEMQFNVYAFNPKANLDVQEFDIVYSDGYDLVIVECKTRPLNQDDVQKLENLRRVYSGVLGKAVLLTSLPAEQAVKNGVQARVEKSSSFAIFCGQEGIRQLSEHMMDFKTGRIYGAKEEE